MLTPKVAALLGIPKSTQERFAPTMAAAAEGEVLVYGPIVNAEEQSFYAAFLEDDTLVSDKSFREALNEIEGDVTLRINSPGGDVWAASGMQSAVIERRNKGDKVHVIIDGVAASAATLLPIVADSVKIAPMGQMMIHEPHSCMCGTAKDFEGMAAFLRKTADQAAEMYAKRMDVDLEAVLERMAEETWYTAEEAVNAGLADEVLEVKEPAGDQPVDAAAAARLFERRAANLALAGAL